MRIKHTTAFIIMALSLGGGGALMALFYFTPSNLGQYPELSFPSVRGASVERFRLPADETLLGSAAGGGEYGQDAVFLTEDKEKGINLARIVRGQAELVFEQAVGSKFQRVEWDSAKNRFSVFSTDGREKVWIAPQSQGYELLPGN